MKAAFGLCALLIAAAGCGGKTLSPVTSADSSVAVVTFQPDHQSIGVPDLPEIWAELSSPLTSTGLANEVTLKQESQFVTIAVSLDSSAKRIVIHPRAPLALDRTYTVHLGPTLVLSDGSSARLEFSWQFKTTGATEPRAPTPADGTLDESPFVSLLWEAGQTDPINLQYTVCAGVDSLAVAHHQNPVSVGSANYFIPDRSWGLGVREYWCVVMRNTRTGDEQSSLVWRFRTLPSGTPSEIVSLPLSDWGDSAPSDESQTCFGATFAVGGTRRAAIRWDLRSLGERKLMGATISLAPEGQAITLTPPDVFGSLDYWPACQILDPGPPHVFPGGPVAVLRATPQSRFDSSDEKLASFTEAMIRYPHQFHGFVLIGAAPIAFRAADTRLTLTLAVPSGPRSGVP
jgi:hypothetical protein